MSDLQRPEGQVLYHVTPTRNLTGIGRSGLLTRLAKGKRLAVWLVDRNRVEWAVLHVCKRHQVIAEEVSILQAVWTPRNLCRSGRPGLWYTTEDIPPTALADCWSVEDWLGDMAPGEEDYPDAPEGVPVGG